MINSGRVSTVPCNHSPVIDARGYGTAPFERLEGHYTCGGAPIEGGETSGVVPRPNDFIVIIDRRALGVSGPGYLRDLTQALGFRPNKSNVSAVIRGRRTRNMTLGIDRLTEI